MKTLSVIDLTGNLITKDSQERLQEASQRYGWRGLLILKVDESQLTLPKPGGPLGGFFRRPIP